MNNLRLVTDNGCTFSLVRSEGAIHVTVDEESSNYCETIITKDECRMLSYFFERMSL